MCDKENKLYHDEMFCLAEFLSGQIKFDRWNCEDIQALEWEYKYKKK